MKTIPDAMSLDEARVFDLVGVPVRIVANDLRVLWSNREALTFWGKQDFHGASAKLKSCLATALKKELAGNVVHRSHPGGVSTLLSTSAAPLMVDVDGAVVPSCLVIDVKHTDPGIGKEPEEAQPEEAQPNQSEGQPDPKTNQLNQRNEQRGLFFDASHATVATVALNDTAPTLCVLKHILHCTSSKIWQYSLDGAIAIALNQNARSLDPLASRWDSYLNEGRLTIVRHFPSRQAALRLLSTDWDSKEEHVYRHQVRRMSLSGEETWSAVQVALAGSGGNRVLLVIEDDISELKRLQKNEVPAARMQSFYANLSHELRTPLHGVLGMSQMLTTTECTQEQDAIIQTIWRSAGQLGSIIGDLLEHSKLHKKEISLELEPFVFLQAVERSVLFVAPEAAKKGLDLALHVGDIPLRLVGDSMKLGQIIVHLVRNAVKFTDSGSVMVDVVPVDGSSHNKEHAVAIAIEVKDTGCGIARHALDSVFEPYFQGDASAARSHGGTGLGLAIAREIAMLMGGNITVSSVVGSGSSFTAYVVLATEESLPSYQSRAPRIHAGQLVRSPALGSVLAVEDLPASANVLSGILRGLGYAVDMVHTWKEAERRLARGEYYALVGSYACCREHMGKHVRRLSPSTLVVVSIAVTDASLLQPLRLDGVRVIARPYRITSVEASLQPGKITSVDEDLIAHGTWLSSSIPDLHTPDDLLDLEMSALQNSPLLSSPSLERREAPTSSTEFKSTVVEPSCSAELLGSSMERRGGAGGATGGDKSPLKTTLFHYEVDSSDNFSESFSIDYMDGSGRSVLWCDVDHVLSRTLSVPASAVTLNSELFRDFVAASSSAISDVMAAFEKLLASLETILTAKELHPSVSIKIMRAVMETQDEVSGCTEALLLQAHSVPH